MQNESINDQSQFFSKLEELQIQRNSTLPTISPPPDKLLSVASASAAAAPVSAPAVSASPPSVIYVPTLNTTVIPSVPIVINGINRDWEYFTSRSIMVWNGSINDSNAYSQIFLNSINIPKNAKINTPYIFLKISTPANNSFKLICSQTEINDNKWNIWRPCSKELSIIAHGYIPATPWTLVVCDIYDNNIDIGKDGATIIEYNKLLNKNSTITLSNTINVEIGHQLLIKKDSTEFQITVLRILNNIIEFDGGGSGGTIIPNGVDLTGMNVCNYNMQIIILMEVKNEKNM
jgi:hypothetical protein